MKTLLTFTNLILVALALLTSGCARKDEPVKWVNPNTIKQGPVLHPKLSDKQLKRISRLQKTFAEVDGTPLSKWINDFSRDFDPDREIKIWEDMAAPYENFLAKRPLSPAGKKEAYEIVLLRSGSSSEETLKRVKLQVLSEADAKEILASYRGDPAPIRGYQK